MVAERDAQAGRDEKEKEKAELKQAETVGKKIPWHGDQRGKQGAGEKESVNPMNVFPKWHIKSVFCFAGGWLLIERVVTRTSPSYKDWGGSPAVGRQFYRNRSNASGSYGIEGAIVLAGWMEKEAFFSVRTARRRIGGAYTLEAPATRVADFGFGS